MIDVVTLRKAWAMLSPHERRNAWVVLGIVSLAALSSAVMVGSVFPFLTVLADTSRIHSISQLDWAYTVFGFTSDYTFLLALGFVTLVFIVVTNGMLLLRTYVIVRYSQMRIYTLSRKLLGHYLSQPYEFFLDRHSGDMSTRVLAEVDQTVSGFFRPFADCVAAVLTILTLILLLVIVNPVVAVSVFVVFGGFYAVIYLVVRHRLGTLGKQRVTANQERFVAAKEVLSGIKEVKLHGNEDVYLNRYGKASFRTTHTTIVSNLIGQLPSYMIQTVAMGGLVLLCVVLLDPVTFEAGGTSALADTLPLIGVIAFAGQRMMPELSRLYAALTKLRFAKPVVDSLFADLESGKVPNAKRRTDARLPLSSELRLEDVTYRYPNSDRTSLHPTSLTIRAGERIGIVGGTGAGKTTIADLILGLLSPTEGYIRADGIVIDEATRSRWQQSVAYVPQEIFLIDASIYENIAFGIPVKQIDQARAEEAGRLAQLDGFVRKDLPQGYETRVGERGVRLSGGQRQRIGIARALYHDADLIIFDEATSALDTLTEREVMVAIDATPGDKTMLIIAHRLTTVRSCDRIIVMEQGKVVAIGSWAELMEKSDAFRELAAA